MGAAQVMGGRLGAHRRWAHTADRSAATEAARQTLTRRFEQEVDPEQTLRASAPAEFERRVRSARRAYYVGIALRSRKGRRGKAA